MKFKIVCLQFTSRLIISLIGFVVFYVGNVDVTLVSLDCWWSGVRARKKAAEIVTFVGYAPWVGTCTSVPRQQESSSGVRARKRLESGGEQSLVWESVIVLSQSLVV